MDGVVKDTFAHFQVGSRGILTGSSLQGICWGEDCCKVLHCWCWEIYGHFAVEEEGVANGGKNSVAQNFRLGELGKGSGTFGGAEGGRYTQEVAHTEGGGNACPPDKRSPRF